MSQPCYSSIKQLNSEISMTLQQIPLELKALLYPPSSMVGLIQILENLNRITTTEKLPLPNKVKSSTKELNLLIKKLKINCHNNSKLLASYDIPANKRLAGTLTHHPLWALLYVDNRDNPFVLALQAAALEAVHGYNHTKLRTHDLQPFGRFIRSISLTETSDSILQYAPSSYANLMKAVKNLISKKLTSIPQETLEDSLRLLRVINNEDIKRVRRKPKHHVNPNFSRGRLEIPQGTLTVLVEGDEDDPNANEDIVLHTPEEGSEDNQITAEEFDELEISGIEKEELEPDFLNIILNNCIQSESTELLHEKLKVSAVRNIIARENATLSNSYNLLTDHELIQLHQLIMKLQESKDLIDKKLSLALWIMLITASKADDLNSFCLLEHAQQFDIAHHSLAYLTNKRAWCIRRIRPNYKTDEACNPSQNRNLEEDYILLPDEFKLYEEYKLAKMTVNKPVFEDLKLKKLLKKKLGDLDERITLAKISRYKLDTAKTLFDPSLVQAMFGIHIATASARQFYSTFTISELRSSYSQLNESIANILGIKHYRSDSRFVNRYLGARYVANTSDTKTSIEMIEDKLASNHNNDLASQHNWFTVKCIFIQSLFTAIRAIRDPFINLSQLELSDTTLTYQDKSGDDFHHVRFQPSHKIIEDIATDYRKHKERVINQLPTQTQQQLKEFPDETFILTSELKALPASPKSLNPFWSVISPYPINSNRKFIKNKLKYLGASQHEIDTVMGHHHEGEAIWSRFNTSSIVDIQQNISSCFHKIIEELNIRWRNINA